MLIIQGSLTRVVEEAHRMSEHGSWSVMYDMLRSICYFPGVNSCSQQGCHNWQACCAGNGSGGTVVPPTFPEIPRRQWRVTQVNTLELSADRSGQHHCVLVCTDVFSKWVEVKPLRRQIATSLAGALTSICCRWGPPDKIRMDNGTEFQTALVQALLAQFGVRVKRGAAHHPQSQGGVERMNRTLIMLMRKVLDQVSDWRRELDLLLFYYISLPYSLTKVSPMHAMFGWKARVISSRSVPGRPLCRANGLRS